VIFANIGGVQLNKGWGEEHAIRAVEMIEADALFLHLNPIQEAIQGGDQDFRGLQARIAAVCEALDKRGIPVFAREVGFGMSTDAARRLVNAGVKGIDCSTIPLIACGGLRSGIDVAKAIALGADVGSMARPFLVAADRGPDAIDTFVEQVVEELRICMFGIGAADIASLKGTSGLMPVV
jgi:isopentenyl-diphosphate delta-isomerase